MDLAAPSPHPIHEITTEPHGSMNHASFASPSLLLTGCLLVGLAGCSPGAQPPGGGGQPAEPTASVSPRQASPGASVQVTAGGFAANSQVEIGFGPPRSEYSVVTTARTDAEGQLATTVQVPDWAERGSEYVWVVADTDNQPKAITGAFVVGASAEGEAVRLEGEITDEGVECPAFRSESGVLYTLAGAPDWASPGDRVIVVGTVAEVSFCMQGTTITVQRVERAG